MNPWIVAAGGLAAFTFCVHLILGQKTVVVPFSQADMAEDVKATMWVCWHAVSVGLAAGAGLLLWFAWHPPNALLIEVLGWGYIAFGALFLGTTLAKPWPNRLFQLPQWTLLAPIGVCALMGLTSA